MITSILTTSSLRSTIIYFLPLYWVSLYLGWLLSFVLENNYFLDQTNNSMQTQKELKIICADNSGETIDFAFYSLVIGLKRKTIFNKHQLSFTSVLTSNTYIWLHSHEKNDYWHMDQYQPFCVENGILFRFVLFSLLKLKMNRHIIYQ